MRLTRQVRRSVYTKSPIVVRRIPNAAIDIVAEFEILRRLAELDAVAVDAVFAGAAVRDIEGVGASGHSADPTRHAGGVEVQVDHAAGTLCVVAFHRHDFVWAGWRFGKGLEREFRVEEWDRGQRGRRRCLAVKCRVSQSAGWSSIVQTGVAV